MIRFPIALSLTTLLNRLPDSSLFAQALTKRPAQTFQKQSTADFQAENDDREINNLH
jgi:hypothetical protein